MTLQEAIVTSVALAGIGAYGLVAKRDLLRLLVSAMLLIGGVTLLAVALSARTADGATLQALILIAWSIEVVEIVIGIALLIRLARIGRSDIGSLRELRW